MSAINKKGFTLIELMVVISIIAILAMVGLVAYSQVQKSARDGKRIADMQEIQKALEQYYAVNSNVFPSALSSVASYFQNGTVPSDPGSNTYTYQHCSSPEKYTMCVKLENTSHNNSDSLTPTNCAITSGTTAFCVASLSN